MILFEQFYYWLSLLNGYFIFMVARDSFVFYIHLNCGSYETFRLAVLSNLVNIIIDFLALTLFTVEIYGLLRDRQLKEVGEAEDKAAYVKISQVFIHIQT